jgi:RNA polymerase sigma-70 factor (ECF subfamily)
MTITDLPRAAVDDADADGLLARAAGGDRQAFGTFYDVTAPRVYALLLALTRDTPRSEALLEEVYVEAWERAVGRGAPPCPAREWVSVLAHRLAAGRR